MKDYGRIVYDADSCVATSARREADEGNRLARPMEEVENLPPPGVAEDAE